MELWKLRARADAHREGCRSLYNDNRWSERRFRVSSQKKPLSSASRGHRGNLGGRQRVGSLCYGNVAENCKRSLQGCLSTQRSASCALLCEGLLQLRRHEAQAVSQRVLALSLKAKTTLTREMPVYPACRHHTRYILAKVAVQRWPPGNELESHPVVEHREPAGGEDDAPAIDPRDMLAFGGRMMRETCLSR
jgi:hypothetical protein